MNNKKKTLKGEERRAAQDNSRKKEGKIGRKARVSISRTQKKMKND